MPLGIRRLRCGFGIGFGAVLLLFPLLVFRRRRQARVVSDDLSVIRGIELIRAAAGNAERSNCPHHVAIRVDFDDHIVELAADQRVAVLETNSPSRQGRRAAAIVGQVLEHDVEGRVDFDDPVVVGIRNQCVSVRKAACERRAIQD